MSSASMLMSLPDDDCLTANSLLQLIKSKSKSKLCYDPRSVGQPVSMSSRIWGPRPDFCYCQTVAGFFMWGALSDERTGLRLKLLLAFASPVILGSKSRGTHDHILLFQIRGSPNLGDPFTPPGTGFPFHRFLRLRGLRCNYLNRLHTHRHQQFFYCSVFISCVAIDHLFDDVIVCLPWHCLATNDISRKAIRSCHNINNIVLVHEIIS
jgi:hypothetical protein